MCEDIRLEIGNKFSLIGVYSGDVVVSDFPATMILAFYVAFTGGTKGDKLVFKGKMGPVAHQTEITLQADSAVGSVTIRKSVVEFREDSEIVLSVSANGGRSKTLIRKRVLVGAIQPRPTNAAATASPQQS